MNVKEIFEKSTNEDKSLTFSQFEELAKANKAKFADLSEGNYVSKQKYEDDIQTKDTQIDSLNATIQTRDDDLSSIKGQLAEAQAELSNAGANATKLEELNQSVADLQAKYDADTEALQSKLSSQAYEFAVRDFASKQKFSSNAAKRDFISSMIHKELPMENGSIMGASDWMKEYAKENKDAFVSDKNTQTTNQPQFSTSTSNNNANTGQKMTLSEMMQMKNDNPNAVISFE